MLYHFERLMNIEIDFTNQTFQELLKFTFLTMNLTNHDISDHDLSSKAKTDMYPFQDYFSFLTMSLSNHAETD
jgi:hypothetical protein